MRKPQGTPIIDLPGFEIRLDMKNCICILLIQLFFIDAAAQENRNFILVHDIDNDGVADTVRIDREELKLEHRLSSLEFRSFTTSRMKELESYGSLEPAAHGFTLSVNNKDDEPYSASYTFTFNPKILWRLEMTSTYERFHNFVMKLPGSAPDLILPNCDVSMNLIKGEILMEYSEGTQRVKKEYTDRRSIVPFMYFSFSNARSSLYELWDRVSWAVLDELYPRKERTPEFIYALPVDPRSPGLLTHDIDGDGVADTVRIHRNFDNWDLWIECRLSSQGFECVTTTPVTSHNNRPGLKLVKDGFELHEFNMDSDNYENSTVFVYDSSYGQLVFDCSLDKYWGLAIYSSDRTKWLNCEGECELSFFPRQGKYVLEYSEDGRAIKKEYIGEPVIIFFKDFMTDNDQEKAAQMWKEFVGSILK